MANPAPPHVKGGVPTPMTDAHAFGTFSELLEFARALEAERTALVLALRGAMACTAYMSWKHEGDRSTPYQHCAACGGQWRYDMKHPKNTKPKHKPSCAVLGHQMVLEAIDGENVEFGTMLITEGVGISEVLVKGSK